MLYYIQLYKEHARNKKTIIIIILSQTTYIMNVVLLQVVQCLLYNIMIT